MEKTALERVIEIVGSQGTLGRHVGVTAQAVQQWKKIPANHVLQIEALVHGAVSRYEMRPDVFGPAPGAPAACASDEPRSEPRDPRSEPKREACA